MRWLCSLCLTIVAAGSFTLLEAGEILVTKSALESDPKGWTDLLANADLKDWKRVSIPPKSKLKEPSPWKFDAAKNTLVCNGVGYHEMLLFDKEIADGVFHIEWRFEPIEGKKGYNSGVYVRNNADGAIWHQAQVGSKNVGNFFGSTMLDGKKAGVPGNKLPNVPQRGKEAGEWNIFEITCKGKSVSLWVNGAVTAEWKNCEVPSGYFGVEAEGYVIEFKKVMYKP